MKQRIDVIVGATIDPSKVWTQEQQNSLGAYLMTAVQDKINRIQGGTPTSDYDGYFEIDIGEPL